MTAPNPIGKYVYTPKISGQQALPRQEISQYSSTHVGINIIANGDYVVPDSIHATVYQRTVDTVTSDPFGDPTTINQVDLTIEDVGVYSFILGPTFTSSLSLITIKWDYVVSGTPYQYWDYYEVLEPMPTYDAMSDEEKGVIKLVANMFADLYDSEDGGPHLKEEFQTHFGTERIAQCMELAANRINITSQPYTNYNVGGGVGTRFPSKFYSVLIWGTYLEVIRHLIRSYTEMPVVSGSAGVAMLDRTNYVDRWRQILQDEKEDFNKGVRAFKRSLLGLGGGALIVSGGIFGNAAYFRSGAYSAAARAGRFYPMSYVNVRGA